MAKKKTERKLTERTERVKAFREKYHSYNELVAAVDKGKLDVNDLRKIYSDFRSQIMKQVKSIQKSDIGFLPGNTPEMRKAKYLITERDLLHELATGLKFYHSKSYTREQRQEQRKMALKKLAEHGIDIRPDQYDDWRRFMQWFKHTEYATIVDSDSPVTLEIFNAGSTVEEWERLFEAYKQKKLEEQQKGHMM